MNKKIGAAFFATETAKETVRQVQLAEALGFHSAWLVDTQLLCREAYSTLGACAVQTSRIRLATGVTNPVTRHASVVASAAATLNELSDGRMMLGISTGNSAVRPIGSRPATVAELGEYVHVLKTLLDNRATQFAPGLNGKINWLVEPSEVPVYVAATNPKLTRAGGLWADGVILFQGISREALERAVGLARAGIVESGRPRGAVDVICWVPLAVASDSRRAHDNIRGRVAAVLKYSRLDMFEGEDRELVRQLKENYDYFQHASAGAKHAKLIPDEMIDRYALAGTPEEVGDRLEQLMNVAGFSTIVLQPEVSDGELSPMTVLRNFAERVLSRFV